MKTALIVGSGLGGLTTAIRLSTVGYKVTIVEKQPQAGGRLNQLKKDGFTWDFGPTFFSMSYEFDEFAKTCGIELPFKFYPLDPLYTVNFSGSNRKFVIHKDIEKLAAEFADLEPDFAKRMEEYLKKTGKLFHDTENRIIRKNFDSLLHFAATLATVPMGHAPKMLRSMWSELNKYFTSYEAKVIFSLVAFFLGATPFDTPAVYSMLTYTELVHDGYHNVEGGMYKIVEGLLEVTKQRNIEIVYNIEIVGTQESGNEIVAVTDSAGKQWKADLFVINSDAASFRGKILKRKAFTEKKLDAMKWTLAPFTMYLGVKGKIEGLEVHNYFLGRNFEEYSSKIFKNSISLEKPYYYVNVPSRANAGHAPEGCEALFILCPVPDLRYKPDWSDSEELARYIISDLSERVGFNIEANLQSKTIINPLHWQSMFNLWRGSGLGLAHDINQIGYFRPHNTDEKFKNLFYVGSSTIPGTGLPMAVISSRLTTDQIVKRYGTVR
jgi:phytoene desaturase